MSIPQYPNLAVLVAEDNPNNTLFMRMLLKSRGVNATFCETGRAAVNAARAAPFDLIFMDLQMPELDGLSATTEIRADASITPQPEIVAVTANAMAQDRVKCLAVGMDAVVTKPVKPATLDEVLARLSAKKAASGS